jgi:hypothetical protein
MGFSSMTTVCTVPKAVHQSRRVAAVKLCDLAAASQVLLKDCGIWDINVADAGSFCMAIVDRALASAALTRPASSAGVAAAGDREQE